jgi:2-dehydro-3-deoxygluconokinase
MALLDPVEDGELAVGDLLRLRVAGAESNFAIGLARLGIGVRWISRLGSDRFGDLVLETLAAEGVDTSFVHRDDARTGLFAKWRSGGQSHVTYYRAGSAASRLQPGDVPEKAFDGVELVHLTGITMALSQSARALVLDVARRAKECGATVLFDPNFRPALPDTPTAAARRQRDVLPFVDWYLCGESEAGLLWGDEQIPARTVIRVGARGAIVDGTLVPPPHVADVVNRDRAGDAFAAGFARRLRAGRRPGSAHAGPCSPRTRWPAPATGRRRRCSPTSSGRSPATLAVQRVHKRSGAALEHGLAVRTSTPSAAVEQRRGASPRSLATCRPVSADAERVPSSTSPATSVSRAGR